MPKTATVQKKATEAKKNAIIEADESDPQENGNTPEAAVKTRVQVEVTPDFLTNMGNECLAKVDLAIEARKAIAAKSSGQRTATGVRDLTSIRAHFKKYMTKVAAYVRKHGGRKRHATKRNSNKKAGIRKLRTFTEEAWELIRLIKEPREPIQEGEQRSRVEAIKLITDYIRERELSKGKIITPDERLDKLLRYSETKEEMSVTELNWATIQKFLGNIFEDEPAVEPMVAAA